MKRLLTVTRMKGQFPYSMTPAKLVQPTRTRLESPSFLVRVEWRKQMPSFLLQ